MWPPTALCGGREGGGGFIQVQFCVCPLDGVKNMFLKGENWTTGECVGLCVSGSGCMW